MYPNETKKALITGITGQDGTYMAQLLVEKGYEVVGTSRDLCERPLNSSLQKFKSKICIEKIDYSDTAKLQYLIAKLQPDELYNFAAFSAGSDMFEDPLAVGFINGYLPHLLLEAVRTESPRTRFIQASSREVFGSYNSAEGVRIESPRSPISPYGIAKNYADQMVKIYRSHFGLTAASAVLFNHESPLRSTDSVTKKIVRGAVQICKGEKRSLELGSLTTRRDWGHAADYVEAMWLMAQAPKPKDFIVASGKLHSVQEIVEIAFGYLGLASNDYVRTSSQFFRSTETPPSWGDSSSIRNELGWKPKISFESMVKSMVQAELDSKAVTVD